jgi:xanthine dehydrogenase accessory factor
VASAKRGAAVRESLSGDTLRLRTPAGIDIGAKTPEHVALSILAEIVAVRAETEPSPISTSISISEQHHCHHEHA